MRKIGNDIVEEGIDIKLTNKERKTVRGVIIKNNEVYMLYSKLFDDFTFPGGGIKDDEDFKEALRRELYEETGAKEIEIIKAIGYVVEYRHGINSSKNIYKQTSYYYLVNVLKYDEPKYVGREKDQGLKMKWVNINDAINHNKKVNNKRNKETNKGFETVLIRENKVLKYLRGEDNEKI